MYVYSIYEGDRLIARGTAQQIADMGLYHGKVNNVRTAYLGYCRTVRAGGRPRRSWEREGDPEKRGPKLQQEKKPEQGSDSINRLNRKGTTRKEKQIARMRQETIGREQRAEQQEKKNALRQADYRKAHPDGSRKGEDSAGSRTETEPHPVTGASADAARKVARCHKPPPPLRPGATPLERDLWELDLLNWERRQAGKPPKSYGRWRWEKDRMKREAAAYAAKARKEKARQEQQEEQDAAKEVPGQAV